MLQLENIHWQYWTLKQRIRAAYQCRVLTDSDNSPPDAIVRRALGINKYLLLVSEADAERSERYIAYREDGTLVYFASSTPLANTSCKVLMRRGRTFLGIDSGLPSHLDRPRVLIISYIDELEKAGLLPIPSSRRIIPRELISMRTHIT